MHPILVDLGGFQIHTYGALGAVGFLFIAFTALWRGKKLGVLPERTADLLFWTALVGLAGSRVVYVLQNPEGMNGPMDWINLRGGGLVFYGALLFGVPIGGALMLRFKMPFFAMWDIFGAAFPVAHGITRLGCFAAGCCHGLPYDGPLSVTFDHPFTAAPKGIPLHPTQLYEAAFLFGLGALVNVLYTRKRFHGQVMLVYLLGYAAGRAFLETFRGDATRGFFLPEVLGELLSYSQGISVLVALVAIGVFFVGARWAGKRGILGAGPVE